MRSKLAASALAIAAVSAAAVPALTGAQAPGPRDVTLRMKVLNAADIEHGAKGPKMATGDRLVVRLSAFDVSGPRVGSAYLECTNIGPKAAPPRAWLQCTQTYTLRDGQIVTAGVFRFVDMDKLNVAVVGGTGAYAGAGGSLTNGAPVQGFDSVDVIHLDG